MNHTLNHTSIFVIARRRAFWATPVAEKTFPHMFLLPAYTSKILYMCALPLIVIRYLLLQPKVCILGTTTPYVRLIAWCRRHGFFKDVIFLTDHQFLKSEEAKAFDAVWVYSRSEIELQDASVRDRFHFLPYPSKANLVDGHSQNKHGYIFCGGNHRRDFDAVLAAIETIDVPVLLITGQPIEQEKLPQSVTHHKRLPLDAYVSAMADALFVVVPLKESKVPHGHSDLSMAISLGKAVISTRSAGVDEYVDEGKGGLLVEPGSVAGYKEGIERLLHDAPFREACERYNQERAKLFSYEAFADSLCGLCESLMKQSPR